jgi:hypothetical protein
MVDSDANIREYLKLHIKNNQAVLEKRKYEVVENVDIKKLLTKMKTE